MKKKTTLQKLEDLMNEVFCMGSMILITGSSMVGFYVLFAHNEVSILKTMFVSCVVSVGLLIMLVGTINEITENDNRSKSKR